MRGPLTKEDPKSYPGRMSLCKDAMVTEERVLSDYVGP